MDSCLTLVDVKQKSAPSPLQSKATRLSVKYWQDRAAEYIRLKRGPDRGQKEVGVVRQTLSLIENGKSNFTIETMVEVLEAVGGDISEMFQSQLPRDLRGQHRIWHEMLYEVMSHGEPDDVTFVEHALRSSYERIAAKRRGKAN